MQAVNITNAIAPQGAAASSGADKAATGGEGGFGSLLSQQLQQAFSHGSPVPQGKALGVGDVSVLDGLKADSAVSGEALGALVSGLVAASGKSKGVGTEVDADLPQVSELAKDVQVPQKDLLIKQESNVAENGAEKSEGADGVPLETNPIGTAVLSVLQSVGKKSDVAETDGKKLPLDLPVDVDKKPDQVIDNTALAAMMGAQLAAHAQQPVADRPKAADAGQFGVGARSPAALENATSKGTHAPEVQIQAEIPSGSKLTADPQSVEPQAPLQSFSSLMVERAGGGAANTAVPALDVPPRVDSPHWGSAVGDKVVWMLGNQNQSAELRLNPPSLGPLEVRVSMNDGQATLSFVTPHAPVREAIEAATPRLREMLGDSGINLGGVSVNVGTFAQQQSASQDHQAQNRSASQYWVAAANETESGSYAAPVVTSVRYLHDGGMVDLFA